MLKVRSFRLPFSAQFAPFFFPLRSHLILPAIFCVCLPFTGIKKRSPAVKIHTVNDAVARGTAEAPGRLVCPLLLIVYLMSKSLFMKKSYLSIFLACLLTFFFAPLVNGQAISADDIKAQMVKDWERGKAYTVDYLNTMPADKYGFKANDSTRSFAQQMLHLAGANVFLMMTATGTPPPSWLSMNLESRASAQNKDSVMFYVTSSYDYCRNAVQNSDMNKWGEKVKVFNTYDVTRFAMMNKTFEHQTHHRGQTTIYIRLVGIKPPQEQLF